MEQIGLLKRRYSSFLKGVSLALIVAFIFQEIAHANPDLKPLDLKLDLLSDRKWAENFFPDVPESVAILEDFYLGSLRAKRSNPEDQIASAALQPPNDKVVVLLQDAHTNYSAQKNESEFLDRLLSKYPDISHVFTEAAWGDVSLSELRLGSSLSHRKLVSEKYLRKGLLHGAEALDLTTEHPFKIWGVEDPTLYKRSVETYSHIAKRREKFHAYLSQSEAAADLVSRHVLNPLLQRFEERRQDFLKQKTSFTDYLDGLWQSAELHNVSGANYKNLIHLKKLKIAEQAIDFEKANRELTAFVQSLDADERQELVAAAKKIKAHKVAVSEKEGERGYFLKLGEMLGKQRSEDRGRKTDDGELEKYLEYRDRADKLDARRTLEELGQFEAELLEALYVNDDEREFVDISRSLENLRKLFSLQLTPEEYQTYKKLAARRYHMERITGFLNEKLMQYDKEPEKVVFLKSGTRDMVKACESFYELTLRRDEKFVGNMLMRMDAQGLSKSVLITGGYHTPNLKRLLEEKNISYISVTPQALHETQINRYEKILFSQDLNQLTLSMPAPAPVVASSAMPHLNMALYARAPGAPAEFGLFFNEFPTSNSQPRAVVGARLAGVFENDGNVYIRDRKGKARFLSKGNRFEIARVDEHGYLFIHKASYRLPITKYANKHLILVYGVEGNPSVAYAFMQNSGSWVGQLRPGGVFKQARPVESEQRASEIPDKSLPQAHEIRQSLLSDNPREYFDDVQDVSLNPSSYGLGELLIESVKRIRNGRVYIQILSAKRGDTTYLLWQDRLKPDNYAVLRAHQGKYIDLKTGFEITTTRRSTAGKPLISAYDVEPLKQLMSRASQELSSANITEPMTSYPIEVRKGHKNYLGLPRGFVGQAIKVEGSLRGEINYPLVLAQTDLSSRKPVSDDLEWDETKLENFPPLLGVAKDDGSFGSYIRTGNVSGKVRYAELKSGYPGVVAIVEPAPSSGFHIHGVRWKSGPYQGRPVTFEGRVNLLSLVRQSPVNTVVTMPLTLRRFAAKYPESTSATPLIIQTLSTPWVIKNGPRVSELPTNQPSAVPETYAVAGARLAGSFEGNVEHEFRNQAPRIVHIPASFLMDISGGHYRQTRIGALIGKHAFNISISVSVVALMLSEFLPQIETVLSVYVSSTDPIFEPIINILGKPGVLLLSRGLMYLGLKILTLFLGSKQVIHITEYYLSEMSDDDPKLAALRYLTTIGARRPEAYGFSYSGGWQVYFYKPSLIERMAAFFFFNLTYIHMVEPDQFGLEPSQQSDDDDVPDGVHDAAGARLAKGKGSGEGGEGRGKEIKFEERGKNAATTATSSRLSPLTPILGAGARLADRIQGDVRSDFLASVPDKIHIPPSYVFGELEAFSFKAKVMALRLMLFYLKYGAYYELFDFYREHPETSWVSLAGLAVMTRFTLYIALKFITTSTLKNDAIPMTEFYLSEGEGDKWADRETLDKLRYLWSIHRISASAVTVAYDTGVWVYFYDPKVKKKLAPWVYPLTTAIVDIPRHKVIDKDDDLDDGLTDGATAGAGARLAKASSLELPSKFPDWLNLPSGSPESQLEVFLDRLTEAGSLKALAIKYASESNVSALQRFVAGNAGLQRRAVSAMLADWMPGDHKLMVAEREDLLVKAIVAEGGVRQFEKKLGLFQDVSRYLKVRSQLQKKLHKALRPDAVLSAPKWYLALGETWLKREQVFLKQLYEAGSVKVLERKLQLGNNIISQFLSKRPRLAKKVQSAVLPVWMPGTYMMSVEDRHALLVQVIAEQGTYADAARFLKTRSTGLKNYIVNNQLLSRVQEAKKLQTGWTPEQALDEVSNILGKKIRPNNPISGVVRDGDYTVRIWGMLLPPTRTGATHGLNEAKLNFIRKSVTFEPHDTDQPFLFAEMRSNDSKPSGYLLLYPSGQMVFEVSHHGVSRSPELFQSRLVGHVSKLMGIKPEIKLTNTRKITNFPAYMAPHIIARHIYAGHTFLEAYDLMLEDIARLVPTIPTAAAYINWTLRKSGIKASYWDRYYDFYIYYKKAGFDIIKRIQELKRLSNGHSFPAFVALMDEMRGLALKRTPTARELEGVLSLSDTPMAFHNMMYRTYDHYRVRRLDILSYMEEHSGSSSELEVFMNLVDRMSKVDPSSPVKLRVLSGMLSASGFISKIPQMAWHTQALFYRHWKAHGHDVGLEYDGLVTKGLTENQALESLEASLAHAGYPPGNFTLPLSRYIGATLMVLDRIEYKGDLPEIPRDQRNFLNDSDLMAEAFSRDAHHKVAVSREKSPLEQLELVQLESRLKHLSSTHPSAVVRQAVGHFFEYGEIDGFLREQPESSRSEVKAAFAEALREFAQGARLAQAAKEQGLPKHVAQALQALRHAKGLSLDQRESFAKSPAASEFKKAVAKLNIQHPSDHLIRYFEDLNKADYPDFYDFILVLGSLLNDYQKTIPVLDPMWIVEGHVRIASDLLRGEAALTPKYRKRLFLLYFARLISEVGREHMLLDEKRYDHMVKSLIDQGLLDASGQYEIEMLKELASSEEASNTIAQFEQFAALDKSVCQLFYSDPTQAKWAAYVHMEMSALGLLDSRYKVIPTNTKDAYGKILAALKSSGYSPETGEVDYAFGAGDILTAFLLTDARALKIRDKLPYRDPSAMKPTIERRDLYFMQKAVLGYNSSGLLKEIGALEYPVRWELEAMGAHDIEEKSLGDKGGYEISFLWSYDAQSQPIRRKIIFVEELAAEPQVQSLTAEIKPDQVSIIKANLFHGHTFDPSSQFVVSFEQGAAPVGYDSVPIASIVPPQLLVGRLDYGDPSGYADLSIGSLFIRKNSGEGARLAALVPSEPNASQRARLAEEAFRNDERLLTVKQAAVLSGLPYGTLRDLLAEGRVQGKPIETMLRSGVELKRHFFRTDRIRRWKLGLSYLSEGIPDRRIAEVLRAIDDSDSDRKLRRAMRRFDLVKHAKDIIRRRKGRLPLTAHAIARAMNVSEYWLSRKKADIPELKKVLDDAEQYAVALPQWVPGIGKPVEERHKLLIGAIVEAGGLSMYKKNKRLNYHLTSYLLRRPQLRAELDKALAGARLAEKNVYSVERIADSNKTDASYTLYAKRYPLSMVYRLLSRTRRTGSVVIGSTKFHVKMREGRVFIYKKSGFKWSEPFVMDTKALKAAPKTGEATLEFSQAELLNFTAHFGLKVDTLVATHKVHLKQTALLRLNIDRFLDEQSWDAALALLARDLKRIHKNYPDAAVVLQGFKAEAVLLQIQKEYAGVSDFVYLTTESLPDKWRDAPSAALSAVHESEPLPALAARNLFVRAQEGSVHSFKSLLELTLFEALMGEMSTSNPLFMDFLRTLSDLTGVSISNLDELIRVLEGRETNSGIIYKYALLVKPAPFSAQIRAYGILARQATVAT